MRNINGSASGLRRLRLRNLQRVTGGVRDMMVGKTIIIDWTHIVFVTTSPADMDMVRVFTFVPLTKCIH